MHMEGSRESVKFYVSILHVSHAPLIEISAMGELQNELLPMQDSLKSSAHSEGKPNYVYNVCVLLMRKSFDLVKARSGIPRRPIISLA